MAKSNYEDTFSASDVLSSESGIKYISWITLGDKMGKEYKDFVEWMSGQTCLDVGAYECDVRNYYYRRDRGLLNSLPHGY